MVQRFLPLLLLVIFINPAVRAENEVTFSEHIAPIVYGKCTRCHRPGEVAPFSLLDYASTKKKARTIQRAVNDKFMPPWHPEEGWGEFRGNLSLSEKQIELINQWVKDGTPEGDPAKAPKVPEFPEGWSLGEPDLIVEMDEAFEVYAEGKDIYRYFNLPLNLDEDQWVTAVEVRPSARSVVHHVLFFLDDTGTTRKMDAADPRPGFKKSFRKKGSLGGWAVGGTPLELSEGFAMPLPKGSDLVLQTHFHPSGKAEKEKTRVGIYFAKKAPEKELVTFQVPPDYGAGSGFSMPPNESEYVVKDHMTVPEDMDLVTIWAHAHQVCDSIQGMLTLPDGTKQKLFRIGEWQFDWQGQYAFKEPLRLKKGTKIETTIVYNNSESNPANPFSPPRRIFWGEESNDEMGSLIFQCVAADKSKELAMKAGLKSERKESYRRSSDTNRASFRQRIVARLDENHDDKLTLKETPKLYQGAFKRLDKNEDGIVTMKEVAENGGFLDRKR